MFLKIFWVVARRQFLVYDQRFGTTCLSNLHNLGNTQKFDAGQNPKNLSNITTTAEAFNYKQEACSSDTLAGPPIY
jgi:hypothetical protein